MTCDDAAKRLVFHAQPEAGAFLEMLRPYRGIQTHVLNDVLLALRAAAGEVSKSNPPRELLSALWAISHLGRLWALDADGMLRANNLITDADLATLRAFLEHFDFIVMKLLDGDTEEQAFADKWQPE